MIKTKTTILLILATIIHLWAQGQQDSVEVNSQRDPLYIGVKYQYGDILAHSSDIESISGTNPWGLTFEVSQLKTKDKSWRNCNCYSKVGLSFSYTNFANPDVLGNAYSMVFFLEPLITYQRNFHVSFRAGMGISYMDNIYDEIENPTNLFYSTSFSFPLLVNLALNYKIAPEWNANLSVFYNHISNGGMRQPNKGINYPTIALGLDYILFPKSLPVRKRVKSASGYPWQRYLGIFATTRSVSDSTNENDNRKLTIGLNGGVTKRLGKIYGFNLGFEASYDGSNREKRKVGNEDYSTYIFSLMAGNNLHFGRYRFSQQFGVYLGSPDPNDRWLFQRYALDYQLTDLLKVGISLKAYGHVAQNIDVRMGIVF